MNTVASGQGLGKMALADTVGEFGNSERWRSFASRIMNCVSRAFRGQGTSPVMEDFIFWSLSTNHGLGLDEIVDKPGRFMEVMQLLYGDAGVYVFEYRLVKEIQAEFGLVRAPDQPRRLIGEQLQAAISAAWASR